MSKFEFDYLNKRFDKLENYLIKEDRLMFESEIIRHFLPEVSISQCNNLSLFQIHFVLFHKLYSIKPFLEKDNYFVSVHFMRMGVKKFPKQGLCRYYDINLNQFCSEIVCSNTSFCFKHETQIYDTELLDLKSIEFFYRDINNYDYFDQNILEQWYKGFDFTVRNHKYYSEAVSLLDLDEDFNLEELKKRYRQLALAFHPDHNSEQENVFWKINRAYCFLLKCITMNT